MLRNRMLAWTKLIGKGLAPNASAPFRRNPYACFPHLG